MSLSRVYLHFLLLLTLNVSVANAEIYKWVDEKGRVHFGDRKDARLDQQRVQLDLKTSNWVRFDINVEARGVELTEREHEEIVEGVNNVYEFFDRVMFFDFYKTVPVKVLVLKDLPTYNAHITRRLGRKNSPSLGIFFSQDNQIIVYMQKDRKRTLKTILHEVSHAVIHTITPYAPAWLNEGLAEQMETIKKIGNHLYIEPQAVNRRAIA